MPSLDDISAQMRAALAVSDPELDTSIGTTTRKIIDAVAEAISEGYIDQHMLAYQYDINSKTGSDLDDFTQLFGLARLAAKRATGFVIFTRPQGSTNSPVIVPINTQVGTLDTVPQIAMTVTAATIQIGQRSVVVPVQSLTAGPSGNSPAGAISTILTPVAGSLSVTNVEALSGGTDQETDDELRERWKKTVFRSLAGTEQMYLGIALDDPDCFAATVLGATKTHTEQVQVASGVATSTINVNTVKFVYPRTSTVSAVSRPSTTTTADFNTSSDVALEVSSTSGFKTSGSLLVDGFQVDYTGINPTEFTGCTTNAHTVLPSGATVTQASNNADVLLLNYDYTFDNTTIPPTIHSTGGDSRLTNGGLFELSYEYVPASSRNVPTASVTNRIDVWAAGTRAVDASQSAIWYSGRLFNDGAGANVGSPYAASLYVRPDGTTPKLGNVFIPLAFGPILTLPEVISVAGTNYTLATGVDGTGQLVGDYQIVHRDDAFGYTPSSLFGIEWNVTHTPPNGSAFSITEGYAYNEVPATIQTAINNWRLLGTNAFAHQAKQVFLRFNLAVMYAAGVSQAVTNSAISTNLAKFLQSISFGSVVQVSDCLRVIANTPGVDNVRFLNGSDFSGYNPANPNVSAVAIQKIVNGGVVFTYCDAITGRPKDIVLADNEVAAFDAIGGGGSVGLPSVRAQNTFGIN